MFGDGEAFQVGKPVVPATAVNVVDFVVGSDEAVVLDPQASMQQGAGSVEVVTHALVVEPAFAIPVIEGGGVAGHWFICGRHVTMMS